MKNLIDKKVILWDFDGVILNSMPIRDKGFEIVLQSYSNDHVNQLLEYHRENGGLSRYVKFRYFHESILGNDISESEIEVLANRFSEVMREELVNPELLISDSLNFIKKYYNDFTMHIVSGSDEKELNYLCQQLKIDHYFHSIKGSPIAKNNLVQNIIEKYDYSPEEMVLIGDSSNDLDAANFNQIDFIGYNNTALKSLHKSYLESFANLCLR